MLVNLLLVIIQKNYHVKVSYFEYVNLYSELQIFWQQTGSQFHFDFDAGQI